MKTTTTLFVSALLASQTMATPIKRRGDAEVVAANMAIYSSNNAVVLAQEASLIALQATWNGGVAGVEATTTAEPVTSVPTEAVSQEAVPTTPTSTAQDADSTGEVNGGAFFQYPSSDTQDDASLPTTSVQDAPPSAPTMDSSSTTAADSAPSQPAPIPSSIPGGAPGSYTGRCAAGSACNGPATAEGWFQPGTGACPSFTASIGYDYKTMKGVAVPQWYAKLMGVAPNNDMAVCGTTVTVISNIDGTAHTAHVVDVDGPGGGQPVEEWLDMSDALYNAVVVPGSNNGGVYPQVQWSI